MPSQSVPTAVPDGHAVPGDTLRVDKTSAGGLRLSWDATADGYGSGSYDYVRITSLAGTSCP